MMTFGVALHVQIELAGEHQTDNDREEIFSMTEFLWQGEEFSIGVDFVVFMLPPFNYPTGISLNCHSS